MFQHKLLSSRNPALQQRHTNTAIQNHIPSSHLRCECSHNSCRIFFQKDLYHSSSRALVYGVDSFVNSNIKKLPILTQGHQAESMLTLVKRKHVKANTVITLTQDHRLDVDVKSVAMDTHSGLQGLEGHIGYIFLQTLVSLKQ